MDPYTGTAKDPYRTPANPGYPVHTIIDSRGERHKVPSKYWEVDSDVRLVTLYNGKVGSLDRAADHVAFFPDYTAFYPGVSND